MNKLENVGRMIKRPDMWILGLICIALSAMFFNLYSHDFYNFKSTMLVGIVVTYLTSFILVLSNSSIIDRITYVTPSVAYTIDQFLQGAVLNGNHDLDLSITLVKIILNLSIVAVVIKYCFKIFELSTNKVRLTLIGFFLISTLILGSGLYIENWFNSSLENAVLSIFKDALILTTTLYLLFLFSFIKPYNYQLKNPIESLKLRFKSTSKPLSDTATFILFMTISSLSLIFKFSVIADNSTYNLDKIAADLTPFYFLYPALLILINFKIEFKTNKMANSLISSIDHRLLERASKRNSHVTTLSFPSFIYTLDNDPGADIINALPATITLIRNEEFKRCLNSLLQGNALNEQQLGSRYFGALNPEKTETGCLDILSLFANIHLEALPLIERRIVGLCKLLPVVDPELAQKAGVSIVERKLANQGIFYYLDFNWVDQHLSRNKNLSTYGTSFEPLPGYLREAINKLEKENLGKGTFIWLSKRAAHQLKLESPGLSQLLTETPVPVSGRNDEIFFTIKIEDILPILSNYETIDKGRQILSDFEPSSDSSKLFEIIKRRISLARNHKEIKHIIDAILSYQWYGYSEKDMALELILLLWQEKVSALASTSPEIYKNLKTTIIESIFSIGYPSKHFHEAQLEKQSIRNIDSIAKVAIDPSHPQYRESWILLAGGIAGRINNEDLPKVLSTITYSLKSENIFSSPLVQAKILDSITFVLPKIESCSTTQIFDLFFQYISAIKNKKISRKQVIQITDRLDYLSNLQDWPRLNEHQLTSIIGLFEAYESNSGDVVSQFSMKIKSQKISES
jgi:hypothetical protein